MSNYGPPIEILEDWNAATALCGCCPMPACPIPIVECEVQTGEAVHDLMTPFEEPGGADTDEIPRLYKDLDDAIEYPGYIGKIVSRFATLFPTGLPTANYPIASETYSVRTSAGGFVDLTSSSFNVREHIGTPEGGYDVCNNTTSGDGPVDFGSHEYTSEDFCSQTETTNSQGTLQIYQSGGTEPTAEGCPGPWGEVDDTWWDYTYVPFQETYTLSNPVTKLGLLSEAVADLGSWVEGGCEASLGYASGVSQINPRWPIKSDGFTGDPPAWPICADHQVTTIPVWCFVKKFRFRLIVPMSWTGSFFKETWDLVFFPYGYDPEDPGSPQPSVIALDQTDSWTTGPGSGEQSNASWIFDGGWHEVNVPDYPGVIRRVNRRFECYGPTPYGNKPQITGEAYEIPE